MTEAERKRPDHVVLPRRLPGLALLERYFPSPADNQLDAELAAFGRPGDTVPTRGPGPADRPPRRSPMACAWSPPIPRRSPSSRAGVPARPRSGRARRCIRPASPPRAAWKCRCGSTSRSCTTAVHACRRPVVGEQFIWPRDGNAPGRKVYRCPNCDVSVGGPPERWHRSTMPISPSWGSIAPSSWSPRCRSATPRPMSRTTSPGARWADRRP